MAIHSSLVRTPMPGTTRLFEIVLEREVCQHLKERAVVVMPTRSISRVQCTSGEWSPVTGRLLLSREPFFRGEGALFDQQAGVVLRDEQKLSGAGGPCPQLTGTFHAVHSNRSIAPAVSLSIKCGAFARPVYGYAHSGGGRSQKQKQPHPIKRDEAAGQSSSVVPPKLQEI